jgi:autotransporter-associated beta strand protein
VTSTLNLTDGTIRATAIQLGPQGGTATITPKINWTNGTIENMASSDLAISGMPIELLAGTHLFNATGAQKITQASTAPISGATFGITKTGTGTLVYNANNTYTGLTTVSQGTLVQNGNHTGGGAYSIDVGGTLAGDGTISQPWKLTGDSDGGRPDIANRLGRHF